MVALKCKWFADYLSFMIFLCVWHLAFCWKTASKDPNFPIWVKPNM